MSLPKLTTNLNNIQALNDQPNANDGLTPAQVKLDFDKAGNDIKTYINDILTVSADATLATKLELANVVLGDIPNGSLTDVKLSDASGQIKTNVTTLTTSVSTLTTNFNNHVVESSHVGGRFYAYNSIGGAL